MSEQNKAAESKSTPQRQVKRQRQALEDAALGSTEVTEVLLARLLNFGGRPGETPEDSLMDRRWQGEQRLGLARRLGRLGGNQALQRTMTPAGKSEHGSSSAGPDPSAEHESRSHLGEDESLSQFRNKVNRPQSAEGLGVGRESMTSEWTDGQSSLRLVQRQGAGGGASEPIPRLADPKRRRSLALDILKKAYGGLIKEESKVVGMPNEGLLRALYDNAMIVMGRVFIEEDGTKRPWAPGDSVKHADMSSDLSGFYDPTSKQVYVDLGKEPDAQVATLVHEILHANASPGFVGTLGKDLDEGMTEKLTGMAFAKSGYSVPSGFFAGQVAVVERLSGIVGLNTLKYAYFNGVGGLRSMMNAKLEEGIFERFALEVRQKNWDWLNKFIERYARASQGTETEKKIAAIHSLLDGWVSDTDLDNIENIWSASSGDEKAEIRKAISPRIGSLIAIGQRTRLRTMLAS